MPYPTKSLGGIFLPVICRKQLTSVLSNKLQIFMLAGAFLLLFGNGPAAASSPAVQEFRFQWQPILLPTDAHSGKRQFFRESFAMTGETGSVGDAGNKPSDSLQVASAPVFYQGNNVPKFTNGLHNVPAVIGFTSTITIKAATGGTSEADLTYSIADAPDWLDTSDLSEDRVLVMNPASANLTGTYTITVEVSDGSASSRGEFLIDIIRPTALTDATNSKWRLTDDNYPIIDLPSDFCRIKSSGSIYRFLLHHKLNGRSGHVLWNTSSTRCGRPSPLWLGIGENGAWIKVYHEFRNDGRHRITFPRMTSSATYSITISYGMDSRAYGGESGAITRFYKKDHALIYERSDIEIGVEELAAAQAPVGHKLATVVFANQIEDASWSIVAATSVSPALRVVPVAGSKNSAVVELAQAAALDFEAGETLVTATIQASTPDTADPLVHARAVLTFKLIDISEPAGANGIPAFVATSLQGSINENTGETTTAEGTAVGTVVANDPDASDTLTYSIESGFDGQFFGIDSGSGRITLNAAKSFDHETRSRYTVWVRASDPTDGWIRGYFVLSITDLLEFKKDLYNVPAVLGITSTVTLRDAAAVSTPGADVTYSIVDAPDWLDTSDLSENRVLKTNPTAKSLLGTHTITLKASDGVTEARSEFLIDVIRPATLTDETDSRWQLSVSNYPLIGFPSDFCRTIKTGSIAQVGVDHVLNGRSTGVIRHGLRCKGWAQLRQSIGKNGARVILWHQFRDDGRFWVFFPQMISPATFSITVSYRLYSRAYGGEAGTITEFYRKDYSLTYERSDITMTVAEVAAAQAPAGHKLATIVFANRIENADWSVLSRSLSLRVAPVAGSQKSAVVELDRAAALDFESGEVLATATIKAFTPDTADPLVNAMAVLVLKLSNVDERPHFANAFADQYLSSGVSATIDFHAAVDPEGAELTYTTASLPTGVSFDAGAREFKFDGSTPPGTYEIRVRAAESDNVNSFAEQVFSLHMNAIVADTSGLDTLTKSATTEQIPVQLDVAPTNGQNVTLTVVSADRSRLAVAPMQMVFTPSTWNSPQMLMLSVTEAGVQTKGSRKTDVRISVFAPITSAPNYRNVLAVTIMVPIDIANASPVFAAGSDTTAKDENTGTDTYSAGEPIGSVTATDEDNPSGLKYAIDPASPLFAINADTGQLSISADTNLNHEIKSTYKVTVVVHDGEADEIRGRASLTVLININDVSERPDAYEDYMLTGSTRSRKLLTLAWNNDEYEAQFAVADRASLAISYQTAGSAATTVDIAFGATVHVLRGLTDDTAYKVSLRWKTEDGQSRWSSEHDFSTPANSPPSFASLPKLELLENIARSKIRTNKQVGMPITATDPDGDSLSYSLVGESVKFRMDAGTGQLNIKGDQNFNYEEKARYTLTVQATDDASPPATATTRITVSIVNMPERPSVNSNANFRVKGASNTRMTVVWNNDEYERDFAPADRASIVVSYYTQGSGENPNDILYLEPDTTEAVIVGLKVSELYYVALRWLSADGYFGTLTHVLMRRTANGPSSPVLKTNSLTASIDENQGPARTAAGAQVGTVQVTPADPGNTITYSILSGADGEHFGIDPDDGALTVKTATNFDYEDKDVYTINVQAQESHIGDVQGAFVLSINAVDENPIFPAFANRNEIRGATFIFPAAADPEGDPLTYSAQRKQGSTYSDLPSGGLSFDPASRQFSIERNASPATLTIRVRATEQDDANKYAQRQFELEIMSGGISINAADLEILTRERIYSSFSVQLAGAPTGANVTIAAASAAPADMSVSPSALVFTPDNWHRPQAVAVSLTDAGIKFGSREIDVVMSVHQQGDSAVNYRNVPAQTVAVALDISNAVPAFGRPSILFKLAAGRQPGQMTKAGTEVGVLTADDADAHKVSYRIVPGEEAVPFDIDSESGRIAVAADTEFEEGQVYRFTVEATDGNGGVAVIGVEVKVIAASNMQEDKLSLAVVDRAMAIAAMDMVQLRLNVQAPADDRGRRLHQDDEPPYMQAVSAKEQWDTWRVQEHEGAVERAERMELSEFLYGGGFDLAMDEDAKRGMQNRLWGSGSRISLEGSPEIEGVTISYAGEAKVFMLGMEIGASERKIGFAAGKLKAEFTMGEDDTRMRRELVLVHPYLSFRTKDDVWLWISGGFGQGEYGTADEGSQETVRNAKYMSAAGGLQSSWGYGNLELSAGIRALGVQSNLDAWQEQPALEVRTWRTLLDFEAASPFIISSDLSIRPFIGAGLRHDGGEYWLAGHEIDAKAGMELNWRRSLRAEFSSRWQINSDGSSDEKRIDGSISYSFGANSRRGLMLSANPKFSRVGNAPLEGKMSAKAGYGLPVRIFSASGIATIQARMSYSKYGIAGNYGLDFAGRRLKTGLTADSGTYTLKLRLH